MSNFICSECGTNYIDCGCDGYKTPREIELEKKLDIAIYFLKKYANVNSWQDCRLYDGDDEEYVEDSCYVEKGYEDAQEAFRLIEELDK